MVESRASPPGRHTTPMLYGRARRPSLHYCMTGCITLRITDIWRLPRRISVAQGISQSIRWRIIL
jgi:hypothetical protein